MTDNVSASGTPVVKYSANLSRTPVVNYNATMHITPVIPTSARKVNTPNSLGRSSIGRKRKPNQNEYPSTKLYNFFTKYKRRTLREHPPIIKRTKWRNSVKATQKRKKEQQNKQNYQNRLTNFERSIKAFTNYKRERNPIMNMLRHRETGYRTGHQQRIIEQIQGAQHIIVTTRDELNRVLHFADDYPVGSTVSLETNAQGDPKIYIVVENENEGKKFVIMNNMNPYNGGTRRIRQKH